MTESQLQQQFIQLLSALSSKHNFVFMAPMNEGVMMVLKIFKVPDKQCVMIMGFLKKMGFRKGASDVQIFHDGKAYFIELKLPGCEQSEDQVRFMKKVLKAGCEYAVARSLDQAEECLKIWGII
jgi:hypothetical protein